MSYLKTGGENEDINFILFLLAPGRAATGFTPFRFFTAQETGPVKELNPLHPWRRYDVNLKVYVPVEE